MVCGDGEDYEGTEGWLTHGAHWLASRIASDRFRRCAKLLPEELRTALMMVLTTIVNFLSSSHV